MKKYLLIICFFSFLSSWSQVPQYERDALIKLYKNTQGHNWFKQDNWNTNQPVSTWYGITVSKIDGQEYVYTINLYKNNLTGEIPRELGNLTKLVLLNLPQNNLRGTIPSEFDYIKTKNFKGNNLSLKTKEEPEKEEKSIQIKSNSLIKTIYFNAYSSYLTPKALNKLGEVVAIMKEYRSAHFTIEGHSDNQNTEEHQQRLSDERATTVMNYLINNGIEENRLVSFRYGSSQPVADNNTVAGRAENRRVEILIMNPFQKKEIEPIPLEAYLKTISFDGLKLTPQIKQELKQTVLFCKNYKKIIYIIEGHTDNQWDAEFSKSLSIKRAELAKQFMVKQGVNEELIVVKGLGNTKPIATNESVLDKKPNNNRLVISLKKRKKKKVKNIAFEIEKITPIKKRNIELEKELKEKTNKKTTISVAKYIALPVIDESPIYPGCKGNNENLKKCMSVSVQAFILSIFDVSITEDIGLNPGKQRMFVSFIIDKQGKIGDVQVKAPHQRLKDELIRIIDLLPEMKPGKHKNKTVSVKINLPISIEVQE